MILKTAIIKRLDILAMFFIMVFCILASSNILWDQNQSKGILKSDAKGYYAYLPATFIYNDPNFGFYETVERIVIPEFEYDYRNERNGRLLNQYFLGTSICQFPFFIIAHTISPTFGFAKNGYSHPYRLSVSLANLCFLFIGMFFLNKILAMYEIQAYGRALTLACTILGTNIFHYVTAEPGMSHVFSFGTITLWVYLFLKWQDNQKASLFWTLSLLMGLLFLIRPTNVLILTFTPFLSGSWEKLKTNISKLFANKVQFIVGLLLFFIIISVQFFFYKWAVGAYFVNSYEGAHFDFSNPHFIKILFSYKKGLFLYTPMYLVGLLSLIYVGRKSKFELISWCAAFIVITYIFSSWTSWYYGGSFSSRVYVEFLVVFMIPIGLLIQSTSEKKRIAISFILCVLIAVCQIQTYQYRYEDIHWGNMTKEKYWDVFLMKNWLK